MRFGILGTSLNPDMSQHLFAADRLLTGGAERLVAEGYPLGPHALAASVAKLGPSLVQAFGGLTMAAAATATIAALGALGRLSNSRRIVAALLVGAAYLAASYYIQGAFKETMQALFVLAFAVGLAELASETATGSSRWNRLKAVPLGLLAVGSLYVYTFPGLTWIVGALGIWAVAEIVRARALYPLRDAFVPTLIAVVVVLVLAAPEIPRMIEFGRFETFNPSGEGLGNLFNPISPIEALGIWPSGDFRLDPGAGFAPAALFYLGGAIGALALGLGLVRALRAGETALAATVAAGATPLCLRPGCRHALPRGEGAGDHRARRDAHRGSRLPRSDATASRPPRSARPCPRGAAAHARVHRRAPQVRALLALVNGPVGPAAWAPALLDFSAQLEDESVLAVVDEELVSENGKDLVTWELRGREVCVVAESEVEPSTVADRAFGAVVVIGELGEPLPVVGRLEEIDRAESGDLEYVLYRADLIGGETDCPFVADGDAAEPAS